MKKDDDEFFKKDARSRNAIHAILITGGFNVKTLSLYRMCMENSGLPGNPGVIIFSDADNQPSLRQRDTVLIAHGIQQYLWHGKLGERAFGVASTAKDDIRSNMLSLIRGFGSVALCRVPQTELLTEVVTGVVKETDPSKVILPIEWSINVLDKPALWQESPEQYNWQYCMEYIVRFTVDKSA